MKENKTATALQKGGNIGLTVVAAATFGTVAPLSAKAGTVVPFTIVKMLKKDNGYHFSYGEVESTAMEFDIDYNQIDKKSQQYGGGTYFTDNSPGIKAVLYGGKVRLVILDNATREWVLEVDENFYGTIPVFFMTEQDSNNNYRMLMIESTGEKMTYKIGDGTLKGGSMQSVYLAQGELTPVQVAYNRYRTYVAVWNDLYRANNGAEHEIYLAQERKMLDLDTINTIQEAAGGAAALRQILSDEGGLEHYYALNNFYGINAEPYYHYDETQMAVYDDWADQLEVGLMRLGVPLPSVLYSEMSEANLTQYEASWQEKINVMGLGEFDYAPL